MTELGQKGTYAKKEQIQTIKTHVIIYHQNSCENESMRSISCLTQFPSAHITPRLRFAGADDQLFTVQDVRLPRLRRGDHGRLDGKRLQSQQHLSVLRHGLSAVPHGGHQRPEAAEQVRSLSASGAVSTINSGLFVYQCSYSDLPCQQ